MCRLELDGTDATEMAVSTDRIVEAFGVLGHVQGSRLAVRVDTLLDPLLLQTSEEGFSDGIVPAVRPPAHAGLKMVGLAEASPCIAPVLCSLIRMNQGLAGLPRTHGLQYRFQEQLSMNRRLHGPTHDLTREQIYDDGQVEPPLPSTDVGDVRHPRLIGLEYRKSTLQHVGDQHMWLGNRDMTYAVAVERVQAVLAHESSNPVPAAGLTALAQIQEYPGGAIDPVTGCE